MAFEHGYFRPAFGQGSRGGKPSESSSNYRDVDYVVQRARIVNGGKLGCSKPIIVFLQRHKRAFGVRLFPKAHFRRNPENVSQRRMSDRAF
jgi:hypothetical protein